MEWAARTSMGAFGQGGIVTTRRLIAVAEHPTNPTVVGPDVGVDLRFVLHGISLTEIATLDFQWEGETSFLSDGTPLSGQLTFTPESPVVERTFRTKPLSLFSIDRLLLLTFSNATNAAFVGDTTLSVLLKAQTPSSGLTVNPDNYVVIVNTTDNVLNVLANDRASAPIVIDSVDAVSGLRIANDGRSLLYSPGNTARTPFQFNYVAKVPTTGETASGRVTMEVEEAFSAQNVSVNVPYNSSRDVDVLLNATPDGKVIVSAIGAPSDPDATAAITTGGGSIRFSVPRDADTDATSSTLSFTVKHTRTSATLTRTLTVTYTTNNALLGGPGPLSKLPWYWGGTQIDYNRTPSLTTICNGRKKDIVMTFGNRGKTTSGTLSEEWKLIRGGDLTGIALQGCFTGLVTKDDDIVNNRNLAIIITYDQWPFLYGKTETDSARQDRFEATAAGTFNCGDNGDSDDVYDAFGAKLKRIMEHYGWPLVVVRMNHECNGTASYPHYVRTVAMAQPFINATRRAITRIKAAATSSQYQLYFSINFGRNSSGGSIGPDLWPGKQYCDLLTLDFYDRNPPVPITDSNSMQRYLNNTRGASRIYKKRDGITPLPGCNGPATWADFARQQGVLFAVDEWGLMDPNEGGHEGAEGDNPVFIEGIWNFYNSITDVLAYETYFTQFDSHLGGFPGGRAMYARKWGN